MKPSSL